MDELRIKALDWQIQELYYEEEATRQKLTDLQHERFKLSLEYWKEHYDISVGSIGTWEKGYKVRIVGIHLKDNHFPRRADSKSLLGKPTVEVQVQKCNGDYEEQPYIISGFAYKLESEAKQVTGK